MGQETLTRCLSRAGLLGTEQERGGSQDSLDGWVVAPSR